MNKFATMTALLAAVVATPALAAPVDTSTNATVNIYTPLSFNPETDASMDFGSLTAPATGRTATSFVLTSTADATVTCGASPWSCEGETKAAFFSMTGNADAEIRVRLDDEVLLTSASDANDKVKLKPSTSFSMTSNENGTTGDTADDYSVGYVTADGDGLAEFHIGGTLEVVADQPDGVYSGSFNVTTEYR